MAIPPSRPSRKINEKGRTKNTDIITPEEPDKESKAIDVREKDVGPIIVDPRPPGERRKLYFTGGRTEIAAQLVYELDPDGNQLFVANLTDYTGQRVRIFAKDPEDLRQRWINPDQRAGATFFGKFGPGARSILDDLLEKYAHDGETQFVLPDVLKGAPDFNPW